MGTFTAFLELRAYAGSSRMMMGNGGHTGIVVAV